MQQLTVSFSKINDEGLSIKDLVKRATIYRKSNGIFAIDVEIRDKYAYVSNSVWDGSVHGLYISTLNIGGIWYEEHELLDEGLYKHKDYYSFELNFDTGHQSYETVVIPMKYKYRWLFVPKDDYYFYDNPEPMEIN